MPVVPVAGRIMRAIRVAEFGSPEVLKLQNDVPIPEPSGKEVLIKVKSAGVNPAETYIRSGNRDVLPALPYTPGKDASGIVEKVGSKVTKFKPGDRVYTAVMSYGSYAEFCVAAESRVQRLPENMTFQQGAAIGIPYYTAYRSLLVRSKARASETVLIHGASGAVGTACLQQGSAYGLNLMGTAGTPKGLELIAKHGAEKVFNHREEGYTKQIMEATGGKGIDVIIEMLANVNLQNDLDLLARHGRVVVVGNRGMTQVDARKTIKKETCILGIALTDIDDFEYDEIAAAVSAGMAKGFLNPVVGLEYPLEEAAEAHREVIDHKQGTHGKIVLNM